MKALRRVLYFFLLPTLAASWVTLFGFAVHWEQTRPTQPDQANGYVHYLKSVNGVVYLNSTDRLIEQGVGSIAIVSSLCFIALAIWLRVRRA